MKFIPFISAVLLAFSVSAGAAIRINPGHSLIYEFKSVPYVGSSRLGLSSFEGRYPRAQVAIRPTSVPNRGLRVKVEMFENSINEAPIASKITSGPFDPEEGLEFWCEAADAWQDFQGVIRVTVLSGSVMIDQVYVGVRTIDPPTAEDRDINFFEAFIPLGN